MQFFKVIVSFAFYMATRVSASATFTNGTCTNPDDQPIPIFLLSGPDFKNVCVATNITSDTTILNSFQNCCGSNAVLNNIGDGCFTYCNISTGAPQSKWLSCFQGAPGVSSNAKFGCLNGTVANLTAVPFTATPTPAASATKTGISSVLSTTSSAGGNTSTKTGFENSPSPTNKSSMAEHAARVSTGSFVTIALVVFGYILA